MSAENLCHHVLGASVTPSYLKLTINYVAKGWKSGIFFFTFSAELVVKTNRLLDMSENAV